MLSELLSNFIDKFLFLLKAASDGWIVKYLGGNYYEIYKPNNTTKKKLSTEQFIEKYKAK
jgi:hypothetical protein